VRWISCAIFVIIFTQLEVNAQSIIQIGSYVSNYTMWNFKISGNYAYLATSGGLLVIDVSNPTLPSLLCHRSSWGQVADIDISDTLACITAGQLEPTSVKILNIADPSNPTLVATYSDIYPRYLSQSGDIVCYIGYAGTLFNVLDISDPTSPQYLGGLDIYGFPEDIYISGQYAFIANCDGGLYIIDISNRESPIIAAHFDSFSGVEGVYAIGNYIYAVDLIFDLQIIDITDPYNANIVGSCSILGHSQSVFVNGNRAYVATIDSGLSMIDISSPTNPLEIEHYNYYGYNGESILVDDNYIYYVGGNEFHILKHSTSSVQEESKPPSGSLLLSANYPNPFNAQTTIHYSLPAASDVSLDIFDITGGKIETLVSEKQEAGEHSIVWNAEKKPSGVYFYRIKAGNFSRIEKCVLLK
jgi:hypothetical protein